MNNFELIDDYLTNRLDEQARKDFEHQLSSDPALKASVELQSQIITGLQKARAAELKAMLNKVPVTAAPTVEFSILKIAAGVVGAAIIASAIYLYMQNESSVKMPEISTSLEDSIKQEEEPEQETAVTPEEKKEEKAVAPEKPKANEGETENTKTEPVKKPVLDVVDPSSELSESEGVTKTGDNKPSITRSSLTVDIDSSNKKYAYHYQFSKGKLVLFGSFDKSLFEVLEVHGDKRTVFLFHKNSYYLLDESREDITPLEAIQDKELLKKLNEYRNK